jgi:hypothetical protein
LPRASRPPRQTGGGRSILFIGAGGTSPPVEDRLRFGRLRFFLMDLHDAHDVDVRVFERFLDIGKFRVLNFENEIGLGSHEFTPPDRIYSDRCRATA